MCAVREDSLENICIICICIGLVSHQTTGCLHLLGTATHHHIATHVTDGLLRESLVHEGRDSEAVGA